MGLRELKDCFNEDDKKTALTNLDNSAKEIALLIDNFDIDKDKLISLTQRYLAAFESYSEREVLDKFSLERAEIKYFEALRKVFGKMSKNEKTYKAKEK